MAISLSVPLSVYINQLEDKISLGIAVKKMKYLRIQQDTDEENFRSQWKIRKKIWPMQTFCMVLEKHFHKADSFPQGKLYI